MMGNPAKLQDGVPIIMKVIDVVPCREVGGGRKNTSNVPDCIRTKGAGTLELCQAGLVCRSSGYIA